MDTLLIKNLEKGKDNLTSKIYEKKQYLGEFKERVIVALTIEEVNEKLIYKEIDVALQNDKADKMIITKAVDLKKAKKYILLAKKYNKKCKMVDSLSFIGDIGLIVCSKDMYSEDNDRQIIVKSKLERFREKGLPDIYLKAQGTKISPFYMNIIKKELPELVDDYKEINFFEKILGMKCLINETLGGKIK